ncbi:protease inhibitor I9 family protein [Paenibacillus tyrfis]|uniref:protease inhibitor I9 family protein n=1 Tax=Paenibacillus tyrfis TaxID=1501230 RepID=UPI00209D4E61|nr:protease inhibitor I9 family protein [Paenibacillus tyrfis]MCP1308041.1 protease inhibitor I9 family protein [Paenibacillus tyrfis]
MRKELAKGVLYVTLVGSILFVATGNTTVSAKDQVRIQPVTPNKDEVRIMPVEKISKEFLEKVKGASGKIACIVLLQDSTDNKVYEELEKKIGKFETTHRYNMTGFAGFAADLTKEQILVLKDLNIVSYIESDGVVSIEPIPSPHPVRILPVNPFDEVKQNLPKSISPSDLAKMEALYNQARKLQDEVYSLDIQYSDLLGKYEEIPSFQEEKKYFPSSLSNDELKKLEELYNQICKLRKEGKTSQTNPLWEQYNKILYPDGVAFGS